MINGQALISVVALLNAMITARLLSPDGRGVVTLSLLLGASAFTLTDFGLGWVATRDLAAKKWSRGVIFTSQLAMVGARVVSSFLLISILIYSGLLFKYIDISTNVAVLGGVQVLPLVLTSFCCHFLLGIGRTKAYATGLFAAAAAPFIIICLISGFGTLTPPSLLIAQFFGSSVVAGALLVIATKEVSALKWPSFLYVKSAIQHGIKMHVSTIVSYLGSRASLLLIGAISGNAAVGVYTIAQAIPEKLYLVSDASSTIIFRRAAEGGPNVDKPRFQDPIFLTILISGLLAISLLFFIDKIIIMLFGEEFSDSGVIAAVLLASSIPAAAWKVISQRLNGLGKSAIVAVANSFGTGASLLLGVFFCHSYGPIAFAWATIFGSTASLIIVLAKKALR